MWNNKNKAVTFSFDDGVTQDKRLIEILNKYNLKGTFNINSALLGLNGELVCHGVKVSHSKNNASDIKTIYAGHEIAAHSLTHPSLTDINDDTIAYQVERDRLTLSDLCGYEVVGMAYPNGAVDERVVKIINEKTKIKYARTVKPTDDFNLQSDLIVFNPTVYYVDENRLFDMAEKFLSLPESGNKLLYIWGHSYEMDANRISWERFEEFCKYISGKTNIFYGTNKEIFNL